MTNTENINLEGAKLILYKDDKPIASAPNYTISLEKLDTFGWGAYDITSNIQCSGFDLFLEMINKRLLTIRFAHTKDNDIKNENAYGLTLKDTNYYTGQVYITSLTAKPDNPEAYEITLTGAKWATNND